MSKPQSDRVDALLDRLLAMDPAEREAELNVVEINDADLANQTRELLRLATDPGLPNSLTEVAPDLLAEMGQLERDAYLGERVGPYRIVEFIRRGGMGAVYRAERCDGVYQQAVAVKLLPKGLSSPARRELFERERSRLARLEHPNIARIIDAGYTNDQVPYFVMELIDGVSINEAAGDRRAGLELFEQLCDAVSFCHRALVVHGDLKPDNILISDGRVRLFDFGIGRLIEEAGGSDDLRPVGYSPGYAAPEIVDGRSPTVSSDVFSLGKILSALLPGTPTAEFSAIVDRCTAIEPGERYRSVESLRADIVALQHGYPVTALGHSRTYLLRKLISRNRVWAGAIVAVVMSLALGLLLAMSQYREARSEALRAQAVSNFVRSLFDRADPDRAGQSDLTLHQLMDEAQRRIEHELGQAPEVANELRQLIAVGYGGLGDYQQAVILHQQVLLYLESHRLSPHLNLAQAQTYLGSQLATMGNYDEAIELLRDSLRQLEQLGAQRTKLAADTWIQLGTALGRIDVEHAVAAKRMAVEILRETKPATDPALALALASLGNTLRFAGQYQEAIDLRWQALEIAAANDLDNAPRFLSMLCNIALDQGSLGRHQEAIETNQVCLQRRIDRLGPDHPDLIATYNNIGAQAMSVGDLRTAREALERGMELADRSDYPAQALNRLGMQLNYARLLWHAGETSEAVTLTERVIPLLERSLGADNPAVRRGRSILARIKLADGKLDEALRLIDMPIDDMTLPWQSDVLLWRAEINLANGNRAVAGELAGRSLAIRESHGGYPDVKIAEVEYILALVQRDSEALQQAGQRLKDLPADHYRRRAMMERKLR